MGSRTCPPCVSLTSMSGLHEAGCPFFDQIAWDRSEAVMERRACVATMMLTKPPMRVADPIRVYLFKAPCSPGWLDRAQSP